MHPIILQFGSITIYSYGVMVALGFGLAALLVYRRAPSFGIDRDKVMDLAILILVSGIIGARVFYILLNYKYYMADPLEMLNLSKGGLVWYGGFIASLAALIVYIARKSLDFWAVADLLAPYLALAQSFGRIGCFLNGCCYGAITSAANPFAICFPAEVALRQPSQLYSALVLFLIFVVLRLWQDTKHLTGEIFLAYCLLYSAKRFAMEFYRGDNPRIVFGLTISQGISVLIFALSLLLFIYKGIEWQKKRSASK
ncbi:MAG: prolipoprotein diacylglyceryl transferase [Candidatus Omnitrophota bacterium]|nr:prolipoprotein diacylglyceryl transferase [Candidatus Omnitrophota bacterium]